ECCRSASARGGRRPCPRPDSPRPRSRWSAARRPTRRHRRLRRRSTSSRSRPSSGDRWTDGLAGQPLRRRRPAHRRRAALGRCRRLAVAPPPHGAADRRVASLRGLRRPAAQARDPLRRARVRVSGLIETSLYDALDKAMPDSLLPAVERRTLAWEIADVYDWEVDFTRDVHPGDRFLVLMDRLESGEGERRFGRILAARVNTGRTPNYAFYFEAADRSAGFFDEQGRSLERASLRAPLQFRRVSSRFGGRYHPVLH